MFRLMIYARDGTTLCNIWGPAGFVSLSIASRELARAGFRPEIVVDTRARQRQYEEFIRANYVMIVCPDCGQVILTTTGKHPPDAECQGK